MTIRELVKQLEDVDDDIKDYRVCIRIGKSWNQTAIALEGDIIEVPDNVNDDLCTITLIGR